VVMSEIKRTNSQFAQQKPRQATWQPFEKEPDTLDFVMPTTAGVDAESALLPEPFAVEPGEPAGRDPYNNSGRYFVGRRNGP
jgi:hypothetical protein